jgi:hypothetical protein
LIYQAGKHEKMDLSSCDGKVMVAVYARVFGDGKIFPTHSAIRTPSGKWISKLSNGLLIEHDRLDQLESDNGYGKVWQVFCMDGK